MSLCTAAAYSNVCLLDIVWPLGAEGTEGTAEPLERDDCCLVRHHDLHRDGDLAVAQDLHSHMLVHVEGREQRAASATPATTVSVSLKALAQRPWLSQ
jgi:hypothetical protein